MAKDLPYFKFFCSEWNDGDITLETFEHQGLFINICSYYWSNECNVDFDKLLKRFRGYDEVIDDLSAAGLFKMNNDRTISITFLDEQRDERLEQSKVKSKGGKASAEARRLKKLEKESNTIPTENEHVLKSCSTESQLLRREEKREEDMYTQESFLQRWKDARFKYDNLPTNISGLTSFELVNFNKLKKLYTPEQFDYAIGGLFEQKGAFPTIRLRPTHFLEIEHFEKYLTCWQTKEKLYEKKKRIERL